MTINYREPLFHGGIEEIRFPSDDRTTSLSTDFGDGFYMTEIQNQAEIWAVKKYRKAIENNPNWKNIGLSPIVNIYQLNETKLQQFKLKYFNKMTDEWLNYIIKCRNGMDDNYYDYVEGPMSDDKVYNFVKDLLCGNITRQEFWGKAAFKYPTHQIMIRRDAIFCLEWIKSYIVGGDENDEGKNTNS